MKHRTARIAGSLTVIARGAALFLGIFLLASFLLSLQSGGQSRPVTWLLDLRPLPTPIILGASALAGFILTVFALYPRPRTVRLLTVVIASAATAVALFNTVTVIRLHAAGRIDMAFPLPVSLLVAMMFAGIGIVALQVPSAPLQGRRRAFLHLVCVSVVAACFAPMGSLAQMLVFGKTDYRRPAAFAVVFGSRVYADGRLSDALADRVRTACDLYAGGLVPYIIMSGGPGDGPVHEVEAMRRYAMDRGVPDSAILLDPNGLNTTATIENAHALASSLHTGPVLMMSHAYHLPRIKLECDRLGLNALTVPARESYLLSAMPWFMLREVAAQWVYLVRPLL